MDYNAKVCQNFFTNYIMIPCLKFLLEFLWFLFYLNIPFFNVKNPNALVLIYITVLML